MLCPILLQASVKHPRATKVAIGASKDCGSLLPKKAISTW
jgi:hypothetical protein